MAQFDLITTCTADLDARKAELAQQSEIRMYENYLGKRLSAIEEQILLLVVRRDQVVALIKIQERIEEQKRSIKNQY